jgi:hypothetical protein
MGDGAKSTETFERSHFVNQALFIKDLLESKIIEMYVSKQTILATFYGGTIIKKCWLSLRKDTNTFALGYVKSQIRQKLDRFFIASSISK